MAQNRTINDALQELKKDYKKVLLEAVKQATNTACEDVYRFSMSVLDRYYANYEPSIYNRTDSLWKATIPIGEVEDLGDALERAYEQVLECEKENAKEWGDEFDGDIGIAFVDPLDTY